MHVRLLESETIVPTCQPPKVCEMDPVEDPEGNHPLLHRVAENPLTRQVIATANNYLVSTCARHKVATVSLTQRQPKITTDTANEVVGVFLRPVAAVKRAGTLAV